MKYLKKHGTKTSLSFNTDVIQDLYTQFLTSEEPESVSDEHEKVFEFYIKHGT